MTNFTKQLRSTAGYTIDQMILVIAIIAILVTLVIVSVGWNLINRTSGAKLANQLRQVEDQNGSFYSNFRVWPHQSYTAPAVSPENNVLALSGNPSAALTYSAAVTTPKNFIPGFRHAGGVISHNFSGTGNAITMGSVTNPFGNIGTYMVIQFAGVPFAEAMEAELVIDGGTEATANFGTGRLVAVTGTNICNAGAVTGAATATTARGALVQVCYAGNLLQ
jgi:hypothetical protein